MSPHIPKLYSWIAFDLDDTLHDFQHASQHATEQVFAGIQARYPSITISDLRVSYTAICAQFITQFTDGRESRAYRTERFGALLDALHLPHDHLAYFVDVYATTFHQAITPMDGALEILRNLQSLAHIAIISEGPHDAQERTLQRAGFTQFTDLLLTSNRERISKKDGLFQRFLDIVDIFPYECIIVGDSIEHDIIPAKKLGTPNILFDRHNRHPHHQTGARITHLSYVMEHMKHPSNADR